MKLSILGSDIISKYTIRRLYTLNSNKTLLIIATVLIDSATFITSWKTFEVDKRQE